MIVKIRTWWKRRNDYVTHFRENEKPAVDRFSSRWYTELKSCYCGAVFKCCHSGLRIVYTCSYADLKPAGPLINYGAVDQYLLNIWELFIIFITWTNRLNSTGDKQVSIRIAKLDWTGDGLWQFKSGGFFVEFSISRASLGLMTTDRFIIQLKHMASKCCIVIYLTLFVQILWYTSSKQIYFWIDLSVRSPKYLYNQWNGNRSQTHDAWSISASEHTSSAWWNLPLLLLSA